MDDAEFARAMVRAEGQPVSALDIRLDLMVASLSSWPRFIAVGMLCGLCHGSNKPAGLGGIDCLSLQSIFCRESDGRSGILIACMTIVAAHMPLSRDAGASTRDMHDARHMQSCFLKQRPAHWFHASAYPYHA